MKLAVLIHARQKNYGGHYYSNEVIVEALKSKFDVVNILVAHENSELRNESIYDHIVQTNNIFKASLYLRKFLRKEGITHICSFDFPSSLVCSNILLFDNYLHFHVKCGGPNLNSVYPFFDNTIVFSRENYNLYKKKCRNCALIPNRVKKFQIDQTRIEDLRKKYDFKDSDKVVLRISRFSNHYEDSLYKILNLAKRVGDRYKIFLIGYIKDTEVYNNFKINISDVNNIYVETEDYYSSNAKELIGIADYVIGTGRGAMEAASLGKKVLVFTSNHNEPVLLTDQNFHCFLKYNFSDRAVCNGHYLSDNILGGDTYSDFILQKYEEYFDVHAGLPRYISFLDKLKRYKFGQKANYFFKLIIIYLYRTIKKSF